MLFVRFNCECKRITIWSAPSPASKHSCPRRSKRPKAHLRAVRLWLLTAAAMIFLTLVVGGATRLTESGLSIVEWKPVTGVLPPLSESEWQAEFAKYQAIPQYRELNRGMSLDAFKVIYWWEWSHRVAGASDRRRVSSAISVLPVARRHSARIARRDCGRFSLPAALSGRSAGGWYPRVSRRA